MVLDVPIRKAVGRGKYDRSASPSDRVQAQRELLIRRTQELLGNYQPQEISIARVIEATGLGRNTLYGHFRNAEGLTNEVMRISWSEVDAVLDSMELPAEHNTPSAGAAALSERWFTVVSDAGRAAAAVVNADTEILAKRLEAEIQDYHALGQRAGAFGPASECAVVGLAGAGVALLRRELLTGAPVPSAQAELPLSQARTAGALAFAQMLMRVLR